MTSDTPVTTSPKVKWIDWQKPSLGRPNNLRVKRSEDNRFVIYNFDSRSGDRYKLFDGGRYVMRGSLKDCMTRAEKLS